MKRIFFIVIPVLLLFSFSSCYKTCEDPFATNYTMKGACIDLTATITGNYFGQLQDSIVGIHSHSDTATIQVSRIDASHVTITWELPGTSTYMGFNATVASSSNGYYLTVPGQTDNGIAVTGAGEYFNATPVNGTIPDGVYIIAGKQLTFTVLAGTQYESFAGTQ